MCRTYSHTILISIFVIMLITGCSGNPVHPDIQPDTQPLQPAADLTKPCDCSRNLLGYYEFSIIPATGAIEVIPVRNADFHLNVTGILNATMGVSAAGVPSESNPPTGKFAFDITVTHPLAANKFTGFDVMGILITPGSVPIGAVIYADADETRLLNADGYTRWWNPTEFTASGTFGYTKGNLTGTPSGLLTATVNPYKYFADILGATSSMSAVQNEPLDSDSGRGVFSAGQANTRRYIIQFEMNPGPVVKYGYAIAASWALPTINPPTAVPDDFPIEANQPEAYYVAMADKVDTLYYDTESGTGGGVLRMQVNVVDWQGQLAGNIKGQVEAVRLYSPDMQIAGESAIFKEETSTKAVYTADLTVSASPTHAGDTLLFARVASVGGPNYNQGFGPAPDANISAFQVMMLDIPDPGCIADGNNDFVDYINWDITSPITDQLCAPTDFKDFFRFDFDPGYEISGDLVLLCDAEPTRMELYDIDEVKITEVQVSGGTAVIDLDVLALMPDQYYLRIVTQTTNQAFLYMLEFQGQLTDITPNPVDVTPPFLFFDPIWAFNDDNYSYFAGATDFWIFDFLMTPDSMPISRTYAKSAIRPGVLYPYACFEGEYWFNPDSVTIVDFTIPSSTITYKDTYVTSNQIQAIAIDDSYIYLVEYDQVNRTLVILDFSSDPSSPTLVSNTYQFPSDVQSLDILDPDGPDKRLIARHGIVVEVINISDPSLPLYISGYQRFSGTLRDLDLEGNYTYNLWSDPADDEDCEVIQVYPSFVIEGQVNNLSQDCWFLDARGDYCYLTNNVDTLTVADFTNHLNPGEGFSMQVYYNSAGDLSVHGDQMLIPHTRSGVGIYYAGDMGSVDWLGDILGINQPGSGVIVEDHIYATQFYDQFNKSLISIDISDPANPFLADYLPTAWQFNQVRASYKGLVLGSTQNQLWTVHNFNPEELLYGAETLVPGSIYGLEMTPSLVYVTDSGNNLYVYDTQFWPILTLQNSITLSHLGYNLTVQGNNLYMCGGDKLYVYSLVDPMNPVLEDSYLGSANFGEFVFMDNYLFSITANTLEIFDMTDPLSFVNVSSTPWVSGFYPMGVTVDGQFGYIPTNGSNSYMYLVWPPGNPVEIGKVFESEIDNYQGEIFIIGDYYIDFRSPHGIGVFDLYP